MKLKHTTISERRSAWLNAPQQKVAANLERFAQEALGDNSKAVHRACARRAVVKIPSLEEYEQRAAAPKLVTT